MNKSVILAGVLFLLGPQLAAAETRDRFERITPEEAGYSEAGLDELRQTLESRGSSAMLLLHQGRIFFEYGDPYRVTTVHSIRKALLNSLVGIHVDRGDLSLGASLDQLGIDDSPVSLTEAERTATIEQLMASRSGIYIPAAAESAGMQAVRPERGSYKPGEFHYYNNWDFNAVGAIFEQETGRGIFEAFRDEIAKPLGMLHYRGDVMTIELRPETDEEDIDIDGHDSFYQYERERSKFPAYHFRMSAHDLALYGQLMLQRGRWEGKQIVSESWIDYVTRPVSVTNPRWRLAYGLMWKVLVPREGAVSPPSFYHTGTGVHMLGIYPSLDLVMVHRVDTEAPYEFNGSDLNTVISQMHRARLPIQEQEISRE